MDVPSLTMPAMSMTATAGVGLGGGGETKIEVNIYPTPGMDPVAIGRAVAAELDRRERAKSTRGRSSYNDGE